MFSFFQVEVASFHQYNGIASNAVPFILALFLGSWSDRRGRKLLLLLGLAGQTYYFAMLALVSSQGEDAVEPPHNSRPCLWAHKHCLPAALVARL